MLVYFFNYELMKQLVLRVPATKERTLSGAEGCMNSINFNLFQNTFLEK